MRSLYFLFVVLVIVGCGGSSSQDVARGDLALLDETGYPGPAYVTVRGRKIAPYGVLVNTSKGGLCSLTHVRGKYLISAGHCANDGTTEDHHSSLYAAFYNKAGVKTFARAEWSRSILISPPGYHSLHDIAVLTLSDEDAAQWDSLETSLDSSLDRWKMGAIVETEAMTYDPVYRWGPNGKELGMRFHTRKCQSSRKPPQLYGLANPSKPADRKRLPMGLAAEYHLFMNCLDPIIQGNSGSLLSVAGDPTQLVGILSGYAQFGSFLLSQFTDFLYVGTDLMEKMLRSPHDFPKNRLIDISYRFQDSLEGYVGGRGLDRTPPADTEEYLPTEALGPRGTGFSVQLGTLPYYY